MKIGNIKKLIFSKTGKNIFFVYLTEIVNTVFGFAVAIILIRGMPKADYGLYTNFAAVMGFIGGIIAGSFGTIAVRDGAEYISVTGKNPARDYGSNLSLQIMCSLIFILVFSLDPVWTSEIFFGSGIYANAILFGGYATFGFILLEMARSIFRASEEFKRYGILRIAINLILAVAVAFLLWSGKLDFFNTALFSTGIYFVLGAGMLLLLRNRLAFSLRTKHIKGALSQGGWLIVYFFFIALIGQMSVFMLSRMESVDQVAAYGVALRYFGFALLSLNAINTVFLSKLSKKDFQDSVKQKDFLDKWISISSLTIVPVAFLALASGLLMTFLNGARYSDAILPFQIFCIGIVTSIMFGPAVNVLISRKKYVFLATLGFAGFMVNVAGNYLLIPAYGAAGAAAATVISSSMVNITGYLRARFLRK